jgi:hypothetical protein
MTYNGSKKGAAHFEDAQTLLLKSVQAQLAEYAEQ